MDDFFKSLSNVLASIQPTTLKTQYSKVLFTFVMILYLHLQ